jgi:hypothetical protein
MNRMLAVLVAPVLALALTSGAHAALIPYSAALGPEPPAVSSGTGTVMLTFDDVAFSLRIQTTFTGLTTGVTVAHIHCCNAVPFSGTSGVAIVTPSLTNFPTGATFGSYDRTFDLTDPASFNPAFVTANGGTAAGARAALIGALNSGRAYLNIHTTRFPAGEIRGFPVPEPATLALAATGFAGLLLARRRRR